MFERYGRTILIIANLIMAVTAVLTLIAIVVAGIFWLGELNSDVERNRQAIVEVRQEVKDVRQELKDVRDELRQEISDTRREILAALEDTNQEIKESNLRMLDALANHTHNDDGDAIFNSPVVQR